MNALSDHVQFQTQAIKLGAFQLDRPAQEFIDWISKELDVLALNFCTEMRTPANGSQQQLVHLILDKAEDVQRIQSDHSRRAAIQDRFLLYIQSSPTKIPLNDPLKQNIFPLETHPFPTIVLTCRPFQEVNSAAVKAMYEEEKDAFLKTSESVWTISVDVVFYFTDAQIQENLENGVSAQIAARLSEIAQKYGFSPPSSYQFDSKESFDRDHQGNWHHYWQ